MNIKNTSNNLVAFLVARTGIPWIVANQNAPRLPNRPYGSLLLPSKMLVGQGEYTAVEDVVSNILAVDQINKKFTIAGDRTAKLLAGALSIVKASTGNDGGYTVVSAVLSGLNTVVTVVEAIPDSTVDGTFSFGYRELVRQGTLPASLVVYGTDDPDNIYQPRQVLSDLQDELSSEDVSDALNAIGLSYSEDFAVQDVPSEVGNIIEPRSSLDINFLLSSRKPMNVDILESVAIEGTLETPDGEDEIVFDFTIP